MTVTCAAALAISVAPGAIGPAAEHLTPPDAVKLPVVDGTAWVVPLSGDADADLDVDPAAPLAFAIGAHDHNGAPVTGTDLAGRLRTGDRLGDLEPPFAAMLADGDGVLVVTDLRGIHQVYGVQGYGWAAVSTSARLLARLADAPLDTDALGTYRIIGHHLGDSTPYQGVRVLCRGHRWRLSGGTLRATPYATPPVDPIRDSGSAVRAGAALLRDYMERCLDRHPDVVLQLSGGLDSRMLLAAVPPSRRRDLSTLTLSSRGNPDAELAALLAATYKMPQQVIDLEELAALTPEQAHEMVRNAAARSDGIGNPIAFAMLDWAEARAPRGPRLTGFGGEIPRGFYYLGQRHHPKPTPALVDRLAKWRVFPPEEADPAMLDPDFAAAARAATLRRIRSIFDGYATDWLSSTDEFYLGERTRRWVGATLTGAALRNQQHSPLLHPYFVEVARSLPPADRRASRYNAAVLAELDPALARIPLDTGRPPAALLARPPRSTLRDSRDFARKAARKARQRLTATGNPTAGVPVLTGLLVRHWRTHPELLAPAAATGLIQEPWLTSLLTGTTHPTPATAGFLAVLTTFTD